MMAEWDQHENRPEPTRVQSPVERLCVEFAENWRGGSRPDLDSFLERLPPSERSSALINLLRIEVQARRERGEEASAEEYRQRYPDASDAISLAFTTQPQARANTQAEADWSVATPALQTLDATQFDPNPVQEVPAPESPWQSGMMLGNYRLEERLDRGGFGEVWKGWDTNLHSTVAIKLLLPKWLNTCYHRQFFEDGQKLRALQQEGAQVVRVLAADDCQGWPYLVSEFLSGGNLQRWMSRQPRNWREAVRVVADLAKTLKLTHARQIYHRDIKPKNVLLDDRGQVYLADFGLAISEDQLAQEGLSTGGTWAYSAPEQAELGIAEGRCDIYSLGVVLYEWLTGRWPGPAEKKLHQQWLRQTAIRAQPLRELNEEIPEELQAICLEMLEKDYRKRNITAGDVERRLRAVLETGCDIGRQEIERRVEAEKQPWHWRGVLVAAGIAVMLGGVALVGLTNRWSDGANRRGQETGEMERTPEVKVVVAERNDTEAEEPLPEMARRLIQPVGQRGHLRRWQGHLELTPGLLDFARRRDFRQFLVIPPGDALLLQSDFPQFLPFGLSTEKPLRQVSWQMETDEFQGFGFFYNFRENAGSNGETQFAGLMFYTLRPPELIPEFYGMHRQFRIDPLTGEVETLGGQDNTRLFQGRAAPLRFRVTLRFQRGRLTAFQVNDELYAIPEGSPQMNDVVGGPYGVMLRRGIMYLSQPKMEFEP